MCKSSCIDKGDNFCLNANTQSGRCYDDDEATNNWGLYCSEDNPNAPDMFKYLVCPNEPACENKYIQPQYDGENSIRQIDKWDHNMLKGDVCSFIVRGPDAMKDYDKLKMTITGIENVEVYVAESKRYRWLTHLDHFDVTDGQAFETTGNFEFYVVGVATSIMPGSYRIRTWVEFGEAPTDEEEEYIAPNLCLPPKQVVNGECIEPSVAAPVV